MERVSRKSRHLLKSEGGPQQTGQKNLVSTSTNSMATHFCSNFQTNTWRSKPYKGNGVGRTATSIWNGGTL
uniref:Uncharacterized protein n=1 Tax=Solanum tuberosum TaxID=4113 RepID=M1C282_SOLTU